MKKRWFAFVSRQPRGGATNEAWDVTTISIGRENSATSPYLIPNEWICGNIANVLRLTLPPFALLRQTKYRKGMFGSLSFSGESTPSDARPEVCVRRWPDICTGILLFDILVANSDRHAGNLKVDDPYDPKEIHVFDHDRALFGIEANHGKARLWSLMKRLGVSGGSQSSGNAHCFLDLISTSAHFGPWLSRISQVPDFFVESICREVVGIGINAAAADAAIRFLNYRKRELARIILANKSEFPSINDWGLTL
jgi:hypothetical protein